MGNIAPLKVTVLGTGTSQGVPVIGCDCEVCRSEDPRDKRLRVSVLLQTETTNVCIDAGPDFRQQMLSTGIDRLDGVVLTHEHNDHIIGIDDVRPFNFRHRKDMPVYATKRVQGNLLERFAYVFAENPYPGVPRLELREINETDVIQIGDIYLEPILVYHGKMPVLGFRCRDFTYITDAKTIPEESMRKIKGTDTLILNALHHRPHYSHLNLEEALAVIEQVQPRQTYLTHISHLMGTHASINPTLPEGVELAYDGLVINMASYVEDIKEQGVERNLKDKE